MNLVVPVEIEKKDIQLLCEIVEETDDTRVVDFAEKVLRSAAKAGIETEKMASEINMLNPFSIPYSTKFCTGGCK